VIAVLISAGALALAIVAALVLSVWHQQERILFQPPAGPWPEVERTRLDYAAADGQRLFAWVVAPEGNTGSAPQRLVISFHGNAEIAAWSIPWAEDVVRHTGATVMLPEYRGYAGLGGDPTYPGSALDASAAWEAARSELHAAPVHTALYGHSLGSAVAAELALRIQPAALLLESPFSSARAMASRVGRWRRG
jgi:uncharacterized protein